MRCRHPSRRTLTRAPQDEVRNRFSCSQDEGRECSHTLSSPRRTGDSLDGLAQVRPIRRRHPPNARAMPKRTMWESAEMVDWLVDEDTFVPLLVDASDDDDDKVLSRKCV
jgi:hypothetical protein